MSDNVALSVFYLALSGRVAKIFGDRNYLLNGLLFMLC
jgi:hypothetical protein